MNMADWLQPHPVPGVRVLRTTLRTAHLIAFGALYGGHVYNVESHRLVWALAAAVGSGLGLTCLEIYRNPIWVVQVRGLATFVKMLVVAAVAIWWNARVWLLTVAIAIGGVVSHMPGRFRYYSVAHRRPVGEDERG